MQIARECKELVKDVDTLRQRVENGEISPNSLHDEQGATLLHYSSKNGNLKAVKYLIEECEADKEPSDNFDRTPLHWATENGHLEIVKYLIEECMVDNDPWDEEDRAPIHYAAEFGHLKIVKYLIEECMVDKQRCDLRQQTPLHFAAEKGHLEVVKYLIEEGKVDSQPLNNNNRTPLHCAIMSGHLMVVKYLIEECMVDKQLPQEAEDMLHMQENQLALSLAAMHGRTKILRYLEKRWQLDTSSISDINVPPNFEEPARRALILGRVITPAEEIEKAEVVGEGITGRVRKLHIVDPTRSKPRLSQVAFKEFIGKDQELMKQWKREVAIMSASQWDYVVRILGLRLESPCGYFMECAISDLHSLIVGKTTLPDCPFDGQTKLRFAQHICTGMSHLYSLNPPISHCDLKSHNVLIYKVDHGRIGYIAKIGDFGMAQIKGFYIEKAVNTLEYAFILAPERITFGCETKTEFSEKSDVYSFGMMVYEMLVEKPLKKVFDEINGDHYIQQFSMETKVQIPSHYIVDSTPVAIPAENLMFLQRIREGYRPPFPAILQDDVEGTRLVNLVKMCWAQDPNERLTFKQLLDHEFYPIATRVNKSHSIP